MADHVKLRLSHYYGDHKPGDEIVESAEVAQALVRSGLARPASVSEARRADLPEDTAASKAAKK